MKRVLSLLILLALLLSCAGSAIAEDAESAVVVKNYKELVSAVNEQGATRVLISAKYKHGTTDILAIEPGGRTVLIAPENGESAVINGRVDVNGEGTVNFENVSIVGPAGEIGLFVGFGANVTIGSVTGGKAKKENGFPAVIVEVGTLTIDSAVGSDGKSGFGGDGIYTFAGVVLVREAVGGSAPKGFGGSGVVAFGGSTVTVTGSATGGNGLYAPGKGVLLGLNGAVEGEGALIDGTELEGKKTLDLETVTNRNMLEYALRSGKTDILLAPGYRPQSEFPFYMVLFPAGTEPVRIASANEKKPATMDGHQFIYFGTWTFENIKFTNNTGKKSDICLRVGWNSHVTASGSITVKGSSMGIVAADKSWIEFTGDCISDNSGIEAKSGATVILNGNVKIKSKGKYAVGATDNGSVTVNGNVDVAGDSNALYSQGGSITVNGTVHVKGSDDYPVVYMSGGEINLTGPLTSDGQSTCIHCDGGKITVTGDVTSKSTTRYSVFMDEDADGVTINGTLYTAGPAYNVGHGQLIINGDVIIRTRKEWGSYGDTKAPGKSKVNGKIWIDRK